MPPSQAAARPRALIVTIYGLYARGRRGQFGQITPALGTPAPMTPAPITPIAPAPIAPAPGTPAPTSSAERGHDGWLPVSLLVRLLAELDVDEAAVRSAISRLKRRDLLVPSRRGGVAGYGLTGSGVAILAEGDARIFAPTEPRLADGWLLAVFSVPESERAKRHVLRTQLGTLGFGACASGVWVAPAHRLDLTRTSLERHGLAPYVDLWHAGYLAFGDIVEHASTWWDLDGVRAAYRDFMAGNATDRPEPADPAEAFAAWVRVLTAWRRLPYLDPGLPVELLPADWPAPAARAVFGAARDRLAEPALEFVTAAA